MLSHVAAPRLSIRWLHLYGKLVVIRLRRTFAFRRCPAPMPIKMPIRRSRRQFLRLVLAGVDLRDYFLREFFSDEKRRGPWPVPLTVRQIEFWDIERFQDTRWDENGMARFDNRRGILPQNGSN